MIITNVFNPPKKRSLADYLLAENESCKLPLIAQ